MNTTRAATVPASNAAAVEGARRAPASHELEPAPPFEILCWFESDFRNG
jgi:hypothetical protein